MIMIGPNLTRPFSFNSVPDIPSYCIGPLINRNMIFSKPGQGILPDCGQRLLRRCAAAGTQMHKIARLWLPSVPHEVVAGPCAYHLQNANVEHIVDNVMVQQWVGEGMAFRTTLGPAGAAHVTLALVSS